MKIIDIHVHVGEPEKKSDSKSYYVQYLLAIRRYMSESGISKCILLSDAVEGYHNVEAQMFYNICSLDPTHFAWMASIDVDTPVSQILPLLRIYKNLGACGIGEIMSHISFDSVFANSLLEAAEQLELPILFHMSSSLFSGYGLFDYSGLPLLESVLQKYPKLKIIGHSQPFWHEISGDASLDPDERNKAGVGKVFPGGRLIELLNKYDNLFCDLSANSGGQAIMRDEEFGLYFLKQYVSHLMFGSDIVGDGRRYPLLNWMRNQRALGNIPKEIFEQITYYNANSVFHI